QGIWQYLCADTGREGDPCATGASPGLGGCCWSCCSRRWPRWRRPTPAGSTPRAATTTAATAATTAIARPPAMPPARRSRCSRPRARPRPMAEPSATAPRHARPAPPRYAAAIPATARTWTATTTASAASNRAAALPSAGSVPEDAAVCAVLHAVGCRRARAGRNRDQGEDAMRMTGAALLGLVLLGGMAGEALAAGKGADACQALVGFTDARLRLEVTAAERVPAAPPGTVRAQPYLPPVAVSLPAHCKVSGRINDRTGADGVRYGIGFELALPEGWNGRFLFQGGGGLNGSIAPALGTTAAGDAP